MKIACLVGLLLLFPLTACAQNDTATQKTSAAAATDDNADYGSYTCEQLHEAINALGKRFEEMEPGAEALAAVHAGNPLPSTITSKTPKHAELVFLHSRIEECRKAIKEKNCTAGMPRPMHPGPAIPAKPE